ncbi:MAG: zinc and cadmium transporter [Patescibacteria group bacterium]|nr:zinc and cadmium transporter [Patescibacteria group bacterium]
MYSILENFDSFWQMVVLTSTLPLISLLAIFLRRNYFTGKIKVLMLSLGLLLLGVAVYSDIAGHIDEVGYTEILSAIAAATVTYFIFSFAHKHNENKNDVKAIAAAEFFHSLMDGLTVGAAYLVNPLAGYAAILAILVHETPKIVGTVILIRSLTNNVKDTIKYSIICQAGVPLAAIFIVTIGKEISGEWQHSVEFAAMATLTVILLRVALHSFRHRGHNE